MGLHVGREERWRKGFAGWRESWSVRRWVGFVQARWAMIFGGLRVGREPAGPGFFLCVGDFIPFHYISFGGVVDVESCFC